MKPKPVYRTIPVADLKPTKGTSYHEAAKKACQTRRNNLQGMKA